MAKPDSGDIQAGPHPVIVFDGMCVLCSANARFILKYDRRGHFRLTTMQSTIGAALMREAGVDPTDPETFIIADGTDIWRNSDAVIAIWKELGWPWKAAAIARLVPRPIRDALYGFVARNRYRMFGRRDQCWIPTSDQASRII